MTYDNTNRGFIRKNEKKETDKHPDYRGEIDIEGQKYWLSGWLNEHENMGGKYFQLSATKKEFKEAKEAAQEPKTSVPEDMEDEIPFMRKEDF